MDKCYVQRCSAALEVSLWLLRVNQVFSDDIWDACVELCHVTCRTYSGVNDLVASLCQEIARLLMEREKKEYRKNREWEKEKERERLAMERMAVERRRQEGDYRVIFHDRAYF